MNLVTFLYNLKQAGLAVIGPLGNGIMSLHIKKCIHTEIDDWRDVAHAVL